MLYLIVKYLSCYQKEISGKERMEEEEMGNRWGEKMGRMEGTREEGKKIKKKRETVRQGRDRPYFFVVIK